MLQCPACQTFNDPKARFCKFCGKPIEVYQPTYAAPVHFAGFWVRFVASLIDGLILSIVLVPLAFILGFMAVASEYANGDHTSTNGFVAVIEILNFLIWALYYAVMESSSTQGTLGKMAMGIKVADQYGQRISFGRALGRTLSKMLSQLIFDIGYMLAGWTKEKTALHDLIVGTRCIKKQL